MANPLSRVRIKDSIDDLTVAAQERMAKMAEEVNTQSFLGAMKIGYRMACEDNGITCPTFKED